MVSVIGSVLGVGALGSVVSVIGSVLGVGALGVGLLGVTNIVLSDVADTVSSTLSAITPTFVKDIVATVTKLNNFCFFIFYKPLFNSSCLLDVRVD